MLGIQNARGVGEGLVLEGTTSRVEVPECIQGLGFKSVRVLGLGLRIPIDYLARNEP